MTGWDELNARFDQQQQRADGFPVHAQGNEPDTTKPVTEADKEKLQFTDGLTPEERRMVELFARMK